MAALQTALATVQEATRSSEEAGTWTRTDRFHQLKELLSDLRLMNVRVTPGVHIAPWNVPHTPPGEINGLAVFSQRDAAISMHFTHLSDGAPAPHTLMLIVLPNVPSKVADLTKPVERALGELYGRPPSGPIITGRIAFDDPEWKDHDVEVPLYSASQAVMWVADQLAWFDVDFERNVEVPHREPITVE